MTSRSSMSAQRRHPRHQNDNASASGRRAAARETHNRFPPADMRARVGRSIMKIWLTVAEASRYSGARKEGAGSPNDGGSMTQRSGRPLTGRLHGHGDGC